MSKRLRKFIIVSIIIAIICIVYLLYINSDGYKEKNKVEVPKSMQIYINEKYVSDSKIGNYNWNQGKLESSFEDIQELKNVSIIENTDNAIKLNKNDIINVSLSDKYSSKKYKIESANLELYLDNKLILTYKAKIENNTIIINNEIKEGIYKCNLKITFKDRGYVEQIFSIDNMQ